MKKILHVNTTLNIGGIETLLLNICKNIDNSKYQFIFLCYRNDKFDLEDEILKLNCKIVRISDPQTVSKLKHIIELIKVIRKLNVDIIHIHTYFDSAYVSLAARICGIKKIIVHSHTTVGLKKEIFFKKIKKKILSSVINCNAKYKLACSKEAGQSLFNKNNFTVITNGIDTEKFSYNHEYRKEIRDKYKIKDNDIIIGHVGRLEEAKNHIFMIKILQDIVKENANYKLMLVGNGSLFFNIQKMVKEKKLEQNVIFVGSTTETYKYYNAFDFFIFPSIYEGLGISLIEAETNGLSCIVSSEVPRESKLVSNVYFKKLSDGAISWKNEILKCKKSRNNIINANIISNSKYSIQQTIKQIEEIYR